MSEPHEQDLPPDRGNAPDREPADAPPQPPVGWLPQGAQELFGPGATAEWAYELLTVDVPAERWTDALEAARDALGCTFFDWLSAVDEPGTGLRVCAHLAALPGRRGDGGLRRLVLRTTVPHEAAVLPTATGVYAGAAWHERETHEMFGVTFTGHPQLTPLLLPDGFEGHPLRKDFVLAARVAKAWPGAKEPGESGHGGPKRRQMLPPGVPDPNEWGPQKGQLPPAPSRPARGRAAATGDRPVRRTRSAAAGSASQRSGPAPDSAPGSASGAPPETEPPSGSRRPPRRMRSASGGSASQRSGPAPAAEPAPEKAGDPASRRTPRDDAPGAGTGESPAAGNDADPSTTGESATPPEAAAGGDAAPSRAPSRERSAGEEPASGRDPGRAGDGSSRNGTPRSADAPWHHAQPAFGDSAFGDSGTGDSGTGDSGTGDGPDDAGGSREAGPGDDETGGER